MCRERIGCVLGAMRHQFPSLLSRDRFWHPELPAVPDPEEAI